MSEAYYDYGHAVRVIRNIRNDGTYPGMDMGTLLVRRGSVGYVRSRGTFLQDQVIYEVHFIDQDMVVGCREEELIDAEEEWVPSIFEFREKVCSTRRLSVNGEVIVEQGDIGQVLKVLRHPEYGVTYHVRFPGHTLLVPEASLEACPQESLEADSA